MDNSQIKGAPTTSEPLTFFTAPSVRVDGVILIDLGWGAHFESEHFFALGHLPKGALLSACRNLTSNDLRDWEEIHTTVYVTWGDEFVSPGRNPQEVCPGFYSFKPSSPLGEPILNTNSLKATILKHSRYRGISPDIDYFDAEEIVNCARFKSWYLGLEGIKEAVPNDLPKDLWPGFCVTGIAPGFGSEGYLEWPEPNFKVALKNARKWISKDAQKVTISQCGVAIDASKLTNEGAERIIANINQFRSSMILLDLMQEEMAQAERRGDIHKIQVNT